MVVNSCRKEFEKDYYCAVIHIIEYLRKSETRNDMTISERIFERLEQLSMTQKEFAQKAGIRQSTISEWKKNKTNPSSDKILAICKALDVSPEWLLSGVDPAESRGKNQQYYTVDLSTDSGILVSEFNKLEKSQRDRILGYVAAFTAMNEDKN